MSKKISELSHVDIRDVRTSYTSDVAIVEIIADVQYDRLQVFTGSARRHPEDKANPDVAILLATARAYTSLSNALQRRSAGLVAHRDDVARLKQKNLLERTKIDFKSKPRSAPQRTRITRS